MKMKNHHYGNINQRYQKLKSTVLKIKINRKKNLNQPYQNKITVMKMKKSSVWQIIITRMILIINRMSSKNRPYGLSRINGMKQWTNRTCNSESTVHVIFKSTVQSNVNQPYRQTIVKSIWINRTCNSYLINHQCDMNYINRVSLTVLIPPFWHRKSL